MDVVLGDLGYKIPWGHTRDLLSPKSGVLPDAVLRSRENGSIAMRIAQGFLVEVRSAPDLRPPPVSVASPSSISFPQRTRSLAVLEEKEPEDALRSSILADEDALVAELETEGGEEES